MKCSAKAVASACLLALAAPPVLAQQPPPPRPAVTQKQAVKPAQAANGEWIRLTGTVKSVAPKMLVMNYGKGDIRVELDPFKWDAEKALKAGDKIVVTGRMDKDFFEARKIEAASIYVPRLNHFFFASPADEEDGYVFPVVTFTWDGIGEDRAWITVTGTVQNIDGNEMRLDLGLRTIQVDTDPIRAGRVGAVPGLLVDVGDRIAVSGWLDDADLFDRREIQATSLVVLRNAAL